MHGAYRMHYIMTAFTGQIFVMCIHYCSRAVYIFGFFFFFTSLNSHFWIFFTYFVDRFYSAPFMKERVPGNFEENFMNKSIVIKNSYFLCLGQH